MSKNISEYRGAMGFEIIQDTIGERIVTMQADCAKIDEILEDLNHPDAQKLYYRKQRVEENIHFLQTIGFFIASMSQELDVLRLQTANDATRIAILRQANAHERIRHNAASVVANLLESKRNHWNEAFENDLKKEFSLEEFEIISHQL